MSSQYSRLYAKYEPYLKNPYTDQKIVSEMNRRLQYANTIEDEGSVIDFVDRVTQATSVLSDTPSRAKTEPKSELAPKRKDGHNE